MTKLNIKTSFTTSFHFNFRIPLFLLLILLIGCTSFKKVERNNISPASLKRYSQEQLTEMKKSSPFMKVHMKTGNVYVLETWNMDDARGNIAGYGALFNVNRNIIKQDNFQIGLDSVSIVETNVIKPSGTATALTVFTGITAAIAVYCQTNPKACFGSCPTFYTSQDSLRPRAEGFSASISPSLEATDIDALFHAGFFGNNFEIEMRNEAMETHVIRHVDLLAVSRPKGRRVFNDLNNIFRECDSLFPPVSAISPEGDCLPLILDADGKERFSKTDSSYLGSKEIIELEFEQLPQRSYGLVIGCRQTLLSTYLLYQTYAYMGNDVGHWMAKIERNDIQLSQNPIQNILGGIEVMTQNKTREWEVTDRLLEYGPLANDIQIIPLGEFSGKSVKIRLRMTKGNWRLDYVSLASLTQTVNAVRLKPARVIKDGASDNQAYDKLLDSQKALVTLPGDTYTLQYNMPNNSGEYELFLESRGYYIEWIRQEWIEEENRLLLGQMFLNPQKALRRLAPEFKKVEDKMEEQFWSSRYAKPEN